MLRRFKKALVASAVIVGLAAASPAWSADQKVYKMSIQTAVPSASLFYELLDDLAKNVDTMSSGRLKIEVLPAGAVVAPFDILDAVSQGVVQGGYAWANYWSGKNPAYVLFTNVPASTGMDQDTLMSWFYYGGGQELYEELNQKVMGLNTVPFMVQPVGPDPLGWFKNPINNMEDFQKVKYRAPPGISGKTYKEMGVAAVAMPAADIVPAAQRGVIDAAEWASPSDDRHLGLQKVFKYYYLQGLHQESDIGELQVNKKFWDSLPKDLQAIFRTAVKAQVAQTYAADIYENSKALHELIKGGTQVRDTPKDYYPKFIKAQNKVIKEYEKDPFFKKVLDSQTEFAKMVYPYHSRTLELYYNLVKTAHEEQQQDQKSSGK